MKEALVLIGGDGPDAPMAWARVDPQGRVVQQGFSDETPPPAAAGSNTMLVLPGAEARIKRLDLPARSEAQARAGAEMLFDGALAQSEATHYAVSGVLDEAGARLVAAISSARLSLWLDRCRALGADPHFVSLDCVLWPAARGEIVIAAHPGRVVVAAGEWGGFSIEPSLAAPVFARWLADARAPAARIVLEGGDANAWRSALGRDAGKLETRPAADPIAELARGAALAPAHAPNLRQGAFAVAGRDMQPLKLWRFAALLAVAALLLQVGALTIAGWRDREAAAQTLAAAERDFRAARPEVGRIVNLRAQVTALTNAMQQAGRHPVLVVAGPTVEALRQQPLARLDEVRHDGGDRKVTLRLSASRAEALEAVAASLRGAGVSLDIRNSQPQDGRVTAEFVVEAP